VGPGWGVSQAQGASFTQPMFENSHLKASLLLRGSDGRVRLTGTRLAVAPVQNVKGCISSNQDDSAARKDVFREDGPQGINGLHWLGNYIGRRSSWMLATTTATKCRVCTPPYAKCCFQHLRRVECIALTLALKYGGKTGKETTRKELKTIVGERGGHRDSRTRAARLAALMCLRIPRFGQQFKTDTLPPRRQRISMENQYADTDLITFLPTLWPRLGPAPLQPSTQMPRL
jgi:hypothetical protein